MALSSDALREVRDEVNADLHMRKDNAQTYRDHGIVAAIARRNEVGVELECSICWLRSHPFAR